MDPLPDWVFRWQVFVFKPSKKYRAPLVRRWPDLMESANPYPAARLIVTIPLSIWIGIRVV
jgi:hypothetical protein